MAFVETKCEKRRQEIKLNQRVLLRGLRNPYHNARIFLHRYFRISFRNLDSDYSDFFSWNFGKLTRRPLHLVLEMVGISNRSSTVMTPTSSDHSITIGETLVLATLISSIQPKDILEIGTGTGFTSQIMSLNSTLDSRITTLDLPVDITQLNLEAKIKPIYWNHDLNSHNEAQARLSEIPNVSREFLDSANLHVKPDFSYDLIFIDGCHDYSYVKNDSIHAFRLIKPGGYILWHDYGMLPDVSRYLDSISQLYDLYAIQGTRFVITKSQK